MFKELERMQFTFELKKTRLFWKVKIATEEVYKDKKPKWSRWRFRFKR